MLNDVCSVVIKVVRPCVTKTTRMTNSVPTVEERRASSESSRRKETDCSPRGARKTTQFCFFLFLGSGAHRIAFVFLADVDKCAGQTSETFGMGTLLETRMIFLKVSPW